MSAGPGAGLVPPATDPRVAAVVRFYEGLTPEGLDSLGSLYADDAWFKDPFNEVSGLPAIRAIFEHMFEKVDAPRFVVREAIAQGDQAFLVWDFLLRFRGEAATRTIRGASHLRFGADGRITRHRDYWDAAEELYEKLPLIGGLMRWLRRRAAS